MADPEENLRFDEHLLEKLEGSRPSDVQWLEAVRFWECRTPAVILGRGGKIGAEVHVDACAAAGVPVLRRTSGGGTVVLGPGWLCFSLVLSMELRPELRRVRRSYEIILGSVIEALGRREVEICGLSDLAWRGRKISGNAQRRTSRALLHQGTLLYEFDATPLAEFLPFPARRPDYRNGRTHGEFVSNFPMAVGEFKSRLLNQWRK